MAMQSQVVTLPYQLWICDQPPEIIRIRDWLIPLVWRSTQVTEISSLAHTTLKFWILSDILLKSDLFDIP